jgi:dienelactone hydrolase
MADWVTELEGNLKKQALPWQRLAMLAFPLYDEQTRPMKDAVEDARAAMTFLRTPRDVDPERLGILGFLRGGHIAFYNGANNPNVKAMVIMACAAGRSDRGGFFDKVRQTKAPTLLLVVENDNEWTDHVALIKKIRQMLHGEGNNAKLIVNPPYKRDGHRMFFEIGDYWQDVVSF